MQDSLLVEILTEELPPKALARLMEAFSHALFEGLKDKHFLPPEAEFTPFATPRRLAVLISSVLARQADRVVERKGPAFASALDASGQPTPALLGFAKSCGVDVSKLERQAGEKGDYFVYRAKQKGEPLKNHLAAIVEAALKKLPVPKTMRWGAGEAQFVRPVHGVILLHGKKVVPGTVLGLKSGNKTRGHRFLSTGALTIRNAQDYDKVLKQQGKVIASFETRRETIASALDSAAHKAGKGVHWDLGKSADLVDEVTSIVEHPVVLAGSFDKAFLAVPKECLIISMQQHQKYFPLADARGELLSNFLFVSNMQASNPKDIIHGNERVLRARLSDARFFFDQDRKTRLEERVPRLANVVYHNKLGSQLQRVQRLQKLAGQIAGLLQADVSLAERAAMLAKADLLTDMVGEFPELQGIMGRYYARHDGEASAVAAAIEQHYFPRTAGGALPEEAVAICVALADKLDTLTGIFGIGLAPSGDKDPFGLRRAALGVVRILTEKSLGLDVLELLTLARGHFPAGVVADSVAQDLHGFMLERLKPYLRDKLFEADEIDAIVSLNPTRFDQVLPRLKALQAFRALPQAEALAAANKRIRNILKQAGGAPPATVDPALLREPAEQQLAKEVDALRAKVQPLFGAGDYAAALKALASLRPAVDGFFDKVMVMAEDMALRHNRLALLANLSNLFLGAADISKLQGRQA
jgi:glycyl-tRNA synthetase beta chain